MSTDITDAGIEQEFSHIRRGRAVRPASREILDNLRAISTCWTKVIAMSTWCDCENAIKLFNEETGRLVDGAQYCLSKVCETS